MSVQRSLSSLERYSLVRSTCGFAPTLSFVASGSADVLNLSHLSSSISRLLHRYPLLSCHVDDKHSKKPTFVSRSITVEEVLFVEDERDDTEVADLLRTGIEEWAKCDLEKGPLWKVRAFQTSDNTVRIQLAINHVLSDGVGSRNLLVELLSPLDGEAPPLPFPPAAESVINFKPSVMHVVKVIASELLVPSLPAFLRPTPAKPPFPSGPLPVIPVACPLHVSTISIPYSTVTKAKLVGNANQVSTLHPVLHSCAISALASTIEARGDTELPVELEVTTPLSVRHGSTETPPVSGNYVSAMDSTYRLSPNATSSATAFWSLTTAMAAQLKSAAQLAEAKYNIGMLAWIPESADANAGNGWEEWIKKKLAKDDGKNSLKSSLEFSNLGLMKLSKSMEGVDVVWAQTANPLGSAITVNAVSTSNGALNITVVLREGVLDAKFVGDFVKRFQQMIEQVAEGDKVETSLKSA